MTRLHEVQDFISAANRVTTLPELSDAMRDTVRGLGFDYYALVHHVDLTEKVGDPVRLIDYPDDWGSILVERDYFRDDPVNAACHRSVAGFRWSDVPTMFNLSPRQQEILSAAKVAGLGDGFTVPVHIPGEFSGSCSFGKKYGRKLPERSLAAAQSVGCFSFEAARRTIRIERATAGIPVEARPTLSDRQLDCMALAAQGKSDWTAGKLLGISNQTVHHHIEEAKRRYSVATRTQLVIRALFDGQLTFGDILE